MNSKILAYLLLFAPLLWQCGSPHEQAPRKSEWSAARSTEKLLLQDMNRYASEKEHDILRAYVHRQNLDMLQSGLGYYYAITQAGQGTALADGDMASLHGRIFLLDGTPCYTYTAQQPLNVTLGAHADLKILNVALRGIARQSHVCFVFPAYQAYGFLGDGDKIPAQNSIACDFFIQ
jgi:FKBP-type peptidyl-prolyl cis-trans isomerase